MQKPAAVAKPTRPGCEHCEERTSVHGSRLPRLSDLSGAYSVQSFCSTHLVGLAVSRRGLDLRLCRNNLLGGAVFAAFGVLASTCLASLFPAFVFTHTRLCSSRHTFLCVLETQFCFSQDPVCRLRSRQTKVPVSALCP